jgi:rSAM/selenodomain-associated transferase 2/rSAM/selenodomain-associated transferase 1
MSSLGALLGIVIPALDEEESLPGLLQDLSRISIPHEVVVSDGGSTDRTGASAREAGALLVDAPRGRASQMNTGARVLGSPWLLFLHSDSRLPESSLRALEEWIQTADPRDFGTFSFALDSRGLTWRVLEAGQRVREGLLGLAYGDQGLLVHRSLFDEVGEFPQLPLMEDVEMLRRLKRIGRWRRIEAPLLTHPRRFQEEGAFRAWLRNVLLITLFQLGVSPHRLLRFYPARTDPSLPLLLVFAKVPTPGRVKTRLAREIGKEAAAGVYSTLGRQVVDQVRGGGYGTVVYFDPPHQVEAMVEWLGGEGLSFRPQVSGDLGDRMGSAVREGLANAPAVVVVGTDAPGVTEGMIGEALEGLEDADLVLGPATDGGYYLIALKTPQEELFREIPWSTSEVLETTLKRAKMLELRTVLLPELSDVDTLEDWERERADLKA